MGEAEEAMSTERQSDSPRCPRCGYVMCQQFDDKRVSDRASLAVPNGTYRCYGCGTVQDGPRQEK